MTTQQKPTPGPWKVRKSGFGRGWLNIDGPMKWDRTEQHVCTVNLYDSKFESAGLIHTTEHVFRPQAEADAQLLAAAPELRDALKAMLGKEKNAEKEARALLARIGIGEK